MPVLILIAVRTGRILAGSIGCLVVCLVASLVLAAVLAVAVLAVAVLAITVLAVAVLITILAVR